MQLRLTGEGSGGLQGGPPGDLYVLVRIQEHELFVRDGADLYCEIPVTFPQLALGHEIQVPVLNGTQALTIPAGTQPNEILRLRGQGLPRLRERRRGDACYRLILEVPRKLTAKQREALESFAASTKGDQGPLSLSFLRADEEIARVMSDSQYWELQVSAPEEISEGLTNFVWELGALGVVEEERPPRSARLRAFFPASTSADATARRSR